MAISYTDHAMNQQKMQLINWKFMLRSKLRYELTDLFQLVENANENANNTTQIQHMPKNAQKLLKHSEFLKFS